MTQSVEAINGVVHSKNTGPRTEYFIYAADLLRIMRNVDSFTVRSLYSYSSEKPSSPVRFVDVFLSNKSIENGLCAVFARTVQIVDGVGSLLPDNGQDVESGWQIETLSGEFVVVVDENGERVWPNDIIGFGEELARLVSIEDAIPLIQLEAEQDCALPYQNQ